MRHSFPSVFAIAATATFLMAGGAGASDLSYTYLKGGAVGVDVDQSAGVANPKNGLVGEVSTEDDKGFYLGASWAVRDRWLVFADYQDASQDISLKGTRPGAVINSDGDFDLIRLSLGVGYVKPMSESWDLYGRLSFEYAEADSLGFPGLPGDDSDDNGFGAQIGARMDLWRRLDGEAYVRYTSVGDMSIERDYSASFDDDVLGGVQLHWSIGNNFGLEAGYEFGEITTWNLGARFEL